MAAVGAMVGAAIFLLVGAAYAVAGPLVLASLALAASIAALAGTAYAELASGRPDASGGAYVWVRSALPDPSGFLSGWLSWGGHIAASALSALGLGVFLVELVRPSDPASLFGPNPVEVSLVALAVLGLSAVLHFARVHLPTRVLGRLTLGKVLLIVGLILVGLLSLSSWGPPRGIPSGGVSRSLPLVLGAVVLFIAFQGFEVVAQLSDQVKRPESSVPRGVFLALLVSFLVYAGFFLAILGNVPSAMLSGWPACNACLGGSEDMVLVSIPNFLGQPYVREAFLVIGVVSMYGALNSNLTAAIRTSFSMARDGLLPRVFAFFLGVAWLAVGLSYHWFAGSRGARGRSTNGSAIEVHDILTTAEDRVELERYRVFLPLREFEDENLVELGARIARARNAELSLLHVVEIPRNLPPKAIRFRYVDDRIRGLQRLARIGEDLGVDTRPVVKIGHKVYEIILDTISEEAVNLLLMSWRGDRVEGDRRVFGSNIDYLIENAPCDVIVFKTQGLRKPLKRIVVLTSPIWSLEGIDDLALILAGEDHAVVEVVSLASDPTEAERLKQESSRFEGRAHERGVTVQPKVVYSSQWESEALRESVDASLLMIRATSPGGLRKFALSPVEDRIVKLAKCPVLILRKWA